MVRMVLRSSLAAILLVAATPAVLVMAGEGGCQYESTAADDSNGTVQLAENLQGLQGRGNPCGCTDRCIPRGACDCHCEGSSCVCTVLNPQGKAPTQGNAPPQVNTLPQGKALPRHR